MNKISYEDELFCLKEFCKKHEFPDEASEVFIRDLTLLHSKTEEWEIFVNQINAYKINYDQDFLPIFDEQQAIGKRINIHPFTIQMLYLILISPHMHELYVQKGYPEDVFISSLLDLKWKLLECKEVYNIWGIFVAWWTIGFFKLKRFGMGRLQFNPRPCPYDYTNGGLVVRNGDITLDTHIPSSGPLYREECLKSYRLAEKFFSNYFVDRPTVFNCHSWLLSPDNDKFLPKYSRILEFAHDYTIIDNEDDPTNSNSWRIFGTMKQPENPENYPQQNKLQKAVVEWLKKGNNIGQGYGIMFFRDGNIIK